MTLSITVTNAVVRFQVGNADGQTLKGFLASLKSGRRVAPFVDALKGVSVKIVEIGRAHV